MILSQKTNYIIIGSLLLIFIIIIVIIILNYKKPSQPSQTIDVQCSSNASTQNPTFTSDMVETQYSEIKLTLPQFLPISGGVFGSSGNTLSQKILQDQYGNYQVIMNSFYNEGETNQRIYCQNNVLGYTNVKLYGISGNPSNYLYVGCDFTLNFLNNGTTYNINLPLANPVGTANQITSGDNVFINLCPYGIQFFNQDSNTNDEILWNFYSNFSFPKFKPGNYLGLVYDDVNLDVYFITTTGNVYIYLSNNSYNSFSSLLKPM